LGGLVGARSTIDLVAWVGVFGLLALAGLQFHLPDAPLFTWMAGGLHGLCDPGLEALGRAIGAPWPGEPGPRGTFVSNWWLPVLPAAVLLLLRNFAVRPLTRSIQALRRHAATEGWQQHAAAPAAAGQAGAVGVPSTPADEQTGPAAARDRSGPGTSPGAPSPAADEIEDPDKTFVVLDGRPHQIGRYEILGELGRGSMGVVYKAADPSLSRTVAIKKILTGQMSSRELETYTVRLKTEAQAGGRLNHPGIVAVYDLVQDRDGMAIVMEFVEGRTLQSVLNQERPKLADCLDLGIQIADALGCAHAQNIIHRDIKPANILITPEGKAKITDFGIAKLAETQLTRTGQLLGTPAFMSPEQFTGNAVRAPTDVFSLGTVLYLLLTGEKPFPGDTITAIAYKVTQTQPIEPRRLNPELPEDLEYVLRKSLSKSAADRYQTGAEMARDLECVRDGRKPTTRVDD